MIDEAQETGITYVQHVLDRLGISPTELARKAGLSVSTLTRPLNDPEHASALSIRTLAKIAKATGVPLPASIRPSIDGVRVASEMASPSKPVSAFSGDDLIPVPIYDIRAAAGAGALVAGEDVEAFEPFRLNRLKSLTTSGTDQLALVTVSGDSMWTTLHNGDQVLVDRSVNRVVKDGIYILALEEELLVKRCQRNLETGKIRVKSDNQDYDTFDVGPERMLQVIGRVIWIGRALG